MPTENITGPDPMDDFDACRECGEMVDRAGRTICSECIDIYRAEQAED